MPPQKRLTNVTKIVVSLLVLIILVIGGIALYVGNVSIEQTGHEEVDSEREKIVKKPTITPLSEVKARDFQRMIDIKQLQAALKVYHDSCNGYPNIPRVAIFGLPPFEGTFNTGCPEGTSFGTISAAVNGTIPTNPTPGGMNYTYCSEGIPGSGKCGVVAKGQKVEGYIITFKLEEGTDTGLTAGEHIATPKGIK